MRKFFMVAIATIMVTSINAQQLDLGMTFIPAASTVNFDMKNTPVSTTLLAQANFSTAKSFHVLAYNFGGTAVAVINGWLYAKDQDAYLIMTKNLKDKEGYLGLGIEHVILNGSFAPTAFVELGTNYKISESYLTIGIFAPLQWTVWKKQ